LWPDDAGGFFVAHVEQHKNKLTGSTYWGSVGIINLDIVGNGAEYKGFMGGDAATDLKCAGAHCEGYISGNTAWFDDAHDVNSNILDHIKGSSNFYTLDVFRHAHDFDASSTGAGSIHLKETKRKGIYEGEASYFGRNNIRTFRARLESGGSLEDLPDNVILTLLLGAPLAVPDDHSGGVGFQPVTASK
jgi:hypothetical protein